MCVRIESLGGYWDVEGEVGKAWSWSSWHRPDRGGQVHSVDRAPHTHSTLYSKGQGRGMGLGCTLHNTSHKL